MKKSKFLLTYIVILLVAITRAQKDPPDPVPNQECYTCSSDIDSDCVSAPTKVKPCNKEDDTCGVVIRDEKTIRGCSEEIGEGKPSETPCQGNKCNDKLFPQNRLKCYQCKNCTSATDETLLPCQNYIATDECYTDVIDETEINRGCMSDKPSHLTEFVKKCSTGDGCNKQGPFVTLTCTECSSDIDKDCIKIYNNNSCKITSSRSCKRHTLLGRKTEATCFTYFKDGIVERGCKDTREADNKYYQYCSDRNNCNDQCQDPIKCLQCTPDDPKCAAANLLPEICKSHIACSTCWDESGGVTRSCGASDKDKCVTCYNADGCNSGKLLQCYSCSSANDKNCATWENTTGIHIETCTDPNEQCATILTEGTTVERGCRLPEKVGCPPDSPNCQLCQDSKCNKEKFPKDLRSCIQCSGAGCEDEQTTQNAKVCDVYLPGDECFTYADKKGVHRGCASDAPNYQQCQESGQCLTCKDDNCNSKKIRKCYTCSSPFDGDCAALSDKIKSENCHNPDEVCTTVISENKVERSCNKPKTCKADDPLCRECADDNCNKDKITPKRCIQCSGLADCEDKKTATICKTYAKDTECYIYGNGKDEVYKGCTSSTEELNKCNNATNGECWKCSEDGCNSQSVPRCLTCTTSDFNKNCAKAIDVMQIPAYMCSSPSDLCTAYLDKDNTVVRGCQPSSKKSCEFNSKNCETCEGDECNKNPIPRTSITCAQCSGTEDCRKVQVVGVNSTQCSTFESCFVYTNSKGEVNRGCLNTDDALQKCKTESDQNCWTCNKDNCNSAEVLKCRSCNTDMSGNCATWKDPTQIGSETCHNPTEICATVVTKDKVERGCKDRSIGKCQPGDPQCQRCQSDNCNVGDVTMKPIRCLQCSDSNDCANSKDPNNATICEKFEPGSGCFVYGNENGVVTRGCSSNVIELNKCNTTTNGNCKVCFGDGCNYAKMPRCLTCTSDLYENCATARNLTMIPSIPCENSLDECISYLYNDTTVKRGCHKFLDTTKICKPNSPDCRTCHDKDNCNTDSIPRKELTCAKCSGTAGCKNLQQITESTSCTTYESCFAYTNSSGHVFRGCLSAVEDVRNCARESNFHCWSCEKDGCNIGKVKTCYTCEDDHLENCGTMADPKSIEKRVCQNPDEICQSFRKGVDGGLVERGCKLPGAIKCATDDPMCRTCNEDNCNTESLSDYPKKCIRCSGTEDCSNTKEAKYCEKFVKDDKCYAYTNKNGEVFRGCMSSTQEFDKCQKDTDGKCWTCNKDSCNKIKMPSCYTCTSGLSENCATANDLSSIPSQFCQNPFDHCVARLVNETVVQRGCQSLMEIYPNCGANSESCKTCEGTDNCNVDPIPRKRFTCLECSGTADCQTGESVKPKTCSTYDRCYIYRDASDKVFRGCVNAATDFDKCVTESNSHCWTCKGDQCNTEKLRKCYTCESDASGACATFKSANPINSETCHNPEEVCAAVRIRDNVQRGCKLPESLNCKPGDPMCRSCTKDNCNDGSLAEYPAKCITCSGTDDCISETDPSKAQYCEKNVDGEPCFAYADNDGKVFRGCVADAEEYDKCQNSTNGHCWKCSGDGCNKITFSHCLSCKSGLEDNCATLYDLNSIPSKVCQNPSQHCISQMVNNTVVVRDCYSVSELPANCGFNSPSCKTCDKDDCNDELVPRKQIKCVQCSGSEDCQNEQDPDKAKTCITYESCVVSKNAVGKTTRGCITKFSDYIDCAKAGNGFCWTCTGDACNTPKVRSCYTCENDISTNCGTWNNPTLITSQACQNPDEICATITTGKKVQRKCEKPENFDCPPGDVSCQKCDTDDCNAGLVHEKPKRCHTCSGTPDCRMEQIEGKEEDCPAYGKPDACFAYTDKNGQAFRGCMSSQKEYENCKNSGNCWTCTGDGCNKDQILECFNCTTALTANCGEWNDATGIETQICKNPGEVCTAYAKDGQTARGCNKPDKTCTPLTETCQNCKEDKCNAGSIPKAHLKCHKCSNTEACQEEQNSTSLSLCSSTETNPSCWAYSDINGRMIRGCTGDVVGFKKCNDSGICRVCNSEGCNNFAYRSTPTLQCHKCNSTEACGWGQQNNTIAPCTNKFAYHLTESCITLKKGDNVERGCTLDLGTCQGNEQVCQTCNTTICNGANIIKQSCIQCKAAEDAKCSGTAAGIAGKDCPATLTTFEDRGCYTRTTDKGVERGCSQDLNAGDLTTCKNDKDHKHCEYCDSENCNNKKSPSAASLTAALTLGLVVLSAVIQILA